MWWLWFQLLIMGAVLCSNVYWQWTPNGTLAVAIAIATAFVSTMALTALLDWASRRS